MKKVLSLFIASVMILSTMSISAFANENTDIVSMETQLSGTSQTANDYPGTESVSDDVIEEQLENVTNSEEPILENASEDEEDTIFYSNESTSYVADVNGVTYSTIDDAIAAWTNGKTLTLLNDVQLSDVVKIKSTEHHILNLSKYTMTAATGKNAFEIIACGTGDSERYAITVNADAENPGTLNAGNKSCIYYDYSKGGISGNDRPIIKINGGIFVGSTSSFGTVGIYAKGTAARKCATFNISGGTFNCSILGTGKSKMLISGGTFHHSVGSQGDSTCYRLISGGRFKSFGFMTADAPNKFGIGSSLSNYDKGVYVDDEGYLVVGGPVITEADNRFHASIVEYSKWSSYLKYSSAAVNSLYYTNAEDALFALGKKGEIVLYTSMSTDIETKGNLKIDMSDANADYTGNVKLGDSTHEFIVEFDSDNPYEGTVTPYTGYVLQVVETPGVKVTRTYSNADAYTKIGDTYYSSLEEAVNKVKDGETITLLKDIELEKSIAFTKDIEFTIDGNGKRIVPSTTSTEANSAFNFGQGNDSTRATRKYNLKNIIFDGWTTDHVVRLQGTTSVIENCTFTNNSQPDGLGLLTLTFSDATVKGCTFKDNTCQKAIDVNSWGDASQSNVTIESCVFDNNTCTQNAVVLVSDGLSTTVKDSKFTNNKVVANINGATLYLGFNTGIKSIGNYFENNAVEISSTATDAARPYRSSGAIFAGFADEDCAIEGNAFINNTLKLDDAQATIKAIAYSAYYRAGDISGNYWNQTTDPVAGVDYTHEYATTNPLTLEDYYKTINKDADNNFTLDDITYIVKDVKLDFDFYSEKEGEKVYNINIKAPGQIINRLNSVDLSFVHTKIEGDTKFEIVASNPEVVINPVDNSPVRYEFHYNGKTDVTTDTAETITIGQVKFTGYGEFSFVVDSGVDTNVAHATKNDNNIVDTFVPGGNTALGYGTFDITDNDINKIVIAVPTRELTIDIAFPNAVENNEVAYQDMTVTIVGGKVNETIHLGKGVDGEYYNFTRDLPFNTAYTVTVEGAGYRTARYTVNLTKDKTLNFWNNVMTNEKEIEVGEANSKTTTTFLAGEIVKDNKINIYDLSAVVSYFGETGLNVGTKPEYAKYDLNRDGKIDAKDVAYVLVSWGK